MSLGKPSLLSKSNKTRRKFVKGVVAGTAGIGLAGCSGNDSEDTPTETEPDDNGGGSTSTPSEGGTDYSDVSFEFWDTYNVQSPAAREAIGRNVGRFEGQTGATINVNWSGYGQIASPQWLGPWSRGDMPIGFTSETADMGKFIINDWVKPVREYQDRLDEDILDEVSWITDFQKTAASGFDNILYELPFGNVLRNPIVARSDHLEAAGFDPDNFSVNGYEDLINKATTLQQDGPGDWGFQIFGSGFDWNDIMHVWGVSEHGLNCGMYNQDWSDVRFNSQQWKDIAAKYTAVYQEHGLSSPQSPTQADEPMVQALNSGRVSMSMPEWLNLPEFFSQAGDKVKDGTIRWYPMWEGDAGLRAMMGVYGIGVTRGGKNKDRDAIERKQDAMIDFINTWYREQFQLRMPAEMGTLPARRGLFKELEFPGEGHNMRATADALASSMEGNDQAYMWEYHPNCSSTRAQIPGNVIPQMLRGELGPSEAMETMHERNQELDQVPYNKDDWVQPGGYLGN